MVTIWKRKYMEALQIGKIIPIDYMVF